MEILKGPKGDALILLITFFLTVIIDLTVAVQVGVVLAALVFVKSMTDSTSVQIFQKLVAENNNETPASDEAEILLAKDIPPDVAVFEINGPFFYSVADLLDEALLRLNPPPKYFVLRLHKTPLIDATGIRALKLFALKCKQKQIVFIMTEVNSYQQDLFKKAGILDIVGKEHLWPDVPSALAYIRLKNCLTTCPVYDAPI